MVVGASGEIGRAITIELIENGCDAALTYHSNRKMAEELARRGENLGRHCFACPLDLRDREAIRELCGRLFDAGDIPSIVVVSAGVFRDRPLGKMISEDWLAVIETNLSGTFYLLQDLAPVMMRRGGGRIVIVASVSGLFGQPGQANYAAAEGGLIAMTRALARELGPFKITVNAIAPGFVETQMTEDLSEGLKRRLLGNIPLRRFATPKDIVPVARLLMAPDGSYVTGQVLVVDGGMTA